MTSRLPAEYQRAGFLLDKLKSGAPLDVGGGNPVRYGELDAAQKQRFSIDWLKQQLSAFPEAAFHVGIVPENPHATMIVVLDAVFGTGG